MTNMQKYMLYIQTLNTKKRGIGRKLLEYSFSKFKAASDNVLISTLEKNSATKFYEKCGGKKLVLAVLNLVIMNIWKSYICLN